MTRPEAAPSLDGRALFAVLAALGLMALCVVSRSHPGSRLIVAAAAAASVGIVWRARSFRYYPLYFLIAYLPFSKWIARENLSAPELYLPCFLLALLAAGVLFLTRAGSEKKSFEGFSLPECGMIVLGGLQLISVFGNAVYGPGYVRDALCAWLGIWGLPFLIFVTVTRGVREPKVLHTLFAVLLMAAVMAALASVWEHLDIGSVNDFDRSRIGSIAREPNMSASYFAFVLFCFLALFLTHWRRPVQAALWLGPAALTFVVMVMTYSRGGYLAMLLGALALCFFRSRILFIAALAAGFFVITQPDKLPGPIRNRIFATVEHDASGQVELDRSSEDRIHVWKGALRLIQQYPLTGVGFNQFETRIAPFWAGTRLFNAHNGYLMRAAENGLFALAGFLLILGALAQAALGLYAQMRDPWLRALGLGFLAGAAAFGAANLMIDSYSVPEAACALWITGALVVRFREGLGPVWRYVPRTQSGVPEGAA